MRVCRVVPRAGSWVPITPASPRRPRLIRSSPKRGSPVTRSAARHSFKSAGSGASSMATPSSTRSKAWVARAITRTSTSPSTLITPTPFVACSSIGTMTASFIVASASSTGARIAAPQSLTTRPSTCPRRVICGTFATRWSSLLMARITSWLPPRVPKPCSAIPALRFPRRTPRRPSSSAQRSSCLLLAARSLFSAISTSMPTSAPAS